MDITIKQFQDDIKQLENLKNKIENEMKIIDNTYEIVDKETTEAFKLRRELLIKEEENQKDKLKNEVTKIKETFEIYLSEIYKLIKAINSFQKEKKSLIETLTYVSTINKTQKKIDKLRKEQIKNMKISYNKDKGKIIYEEYIFNGAPIDSDILIETENCEQLYAQLKEWIKFNKLELLYRATRDGSNSKIFHNKCDNQGPTICLCKNEKGNIFGGYSSISLTSPKEGVYKRANNCFLFSLKNIKKQIPIKFQNINAEKAVYHCINNGPTFGNGHDLKICSNFLKNKDSYANIGNSYEDKNKDGNVIFSDDINTSYFTLKELEVFKLI